MAAARAAVVLGSRDSRPHAAAELGARLGVSKGVGRWNCREVDRPVGGPGCPSQRRPFPPLSSGEAVRYSGRLPAQPGGGTDGPIDGLPPPPDRPPCSANRRRSSGPALCSRAPALMRNCTITRASQPSSPEPTKSLPQSGSGHRTRVRLGGSGTGRARIGTAGAAPTRLPLAGLPCPVPAVPPVHGENSWRPFSSKRSPPSSHHC